MVILSDNEQSWADLVFTYVRTVGADDWHAPIFRPYVIMMVNVTCTWISESRGLFQSRFMTNFLRSQTKV